MTTRFEPLHAWRRILREREQFNQVLCEEPVIRELAGRLSELYESGDLERSKRFAVVVMALARTSYRLQVLSEEEPARP